MKTLLTKQDGEVTNHSHDQKDEFLVQITSFSITIFPKD
jgi:hypothetical protein